MTLPLRRVLCGALLIFAIAAGYSGKPVAAEPATQSAGKAVATQLAQAAQPQGGQSPTRPGATGRQPAVTAPVAAGAAAGATAGGSAAADAAPAKPASVDGFRSARFGMTEAEVEKAALADLKVEKKDIRRTNNPVDRTTILAVEGVELLADSGKATVVYIFGFQSKKLTQVNIVWGGLADRQVAPATVASTGEVLRTYFLGQNYRAEDRVVNAQLGDGSLLLFRGRDGEGRMVMLRLFETPIPSETQGKPPEGRVTLQLSYFERPDNPDVFQIKPGSF